MQLSAPVIPVWCDNNLMWDSSLAAAQRTLRMTKWARGIDEGLRGSAQLYFFGNTFIPSGTRDTRWLCSIRAYAVVTIGQGLLGGGFFLSQGFASQPRHASDAFGVEERGSKIETELTRFVVCMVLRNEWVHGMGSQTMNSVSGLKPASEVSLRNPSRVEAISDLVTQVAADVNAGLKLPGSLLWLKSLSSSMIKQWQRWRSQFCLPADQDAARPH